MSGSLLSSKSHSTNPNAISGLTSSRGIKLRNTGRSTALEDNDSEQELAKADDGLSGDAYHETYVRGGHTNTVITCVDKGPDSQSDNSGTGGIQVKNETKVYYESV
jgi:hypothetical protein